MWVGSTAPIAISFTPPRRGREGSKTYLSLVSACAFLQGSEEETEVVNSKCKQRSAHLVDICAKVKYKPYKACRVKLK